jgi:hypothetical protein
MHTIYTQIFILKISVIYSGNGWPRGKNFLNRLSEEKKILLNIVWKSAPDLLDMLIDLKFNIYQVQDNYINNDCVAHNYASRTHEKDRYKKESNVNRISFSRSYIRISCIDVNELKLIL